MKKLLLPAMLCIALCGCLTMGEIREESKNITQPEITTYSQPIAALLGGFLDDPVNTLSAGAIGYILALARRLYKKKKGSTA